MLKYCLYFLSLFFSNALLSQQNSRLDSNVVSNQMNNQTNNEVEMIDWMVQNGKMNVVISVIAIIFFIIALFLFRLDRKIAKLEKEFK
jgi:CcmD family protein